MNTMILDSTREIIQRELYENEYQTTENLPTECFFFSFFSGFSVCHCKMPAQPAAISCGCGVLRHAKNMNSLPAQLMRSVSLSHHTQFASK